MKNEKAIRIDSDSQNKTLGCRLVVSGNKISSLPLDPFREGTDYYFIKPLQTLDDFKSSLGGISCGNIEKLGIDPVIFNKVKISFKCVYFPVLKCGEKMLPLNSVINEHIMKQYFANGTIPASYWDSCESLLMHDDSFDLTNAEIYPIDLSSKEVDYLVSYYKLKQGKNYEVFFLPIYISEMTNGKRHFTASQLGTGNATSIKNDYVKDNDSFFEAIMRIVLMSGSMAFAVYFCIANISGIEDLTTLIGDFYNIFINFHNNIYGSHPVFANLFLLILFPIMVILGALVLSGCIIFPLLVGAIFCGLILIVYRRYKRNMILNTYCSFANIHKSEINSKIPVAFCVKKIFFSIPIMWPFVIISAIYVILKYII